MPELDPQSRAFREATEADSWDGNLVDLLAEGATYHEPLSGITQIRLPEHHEQGAGWDADREPPKTIEQAREALAARIADPSAPDTEDHAGAYDDLDDA